MRKLSLLDVMSDDFSDSGFSLQEALAFKASPAKARAMELNKALVEMLKEELGSRKKKRKKTDYVRRDEDEVEWEEEAEELNDYREVFKRKVVDYLLAAGSVTPETKEGFIDNAILNFSENVDYKDEQSRLAAARPDVTNVKYEDPVFFNNQWTYQRVFMEGSGKEETVYELTTKAMPYNGMRVETKHDDKFRTAYVTSIDGKRDGEIDPATGKARYWEYWIIDRETGEERIGDMGIEEQKIRKNEAVEWRLATEQESGCGGGGERYDSFAVENDPTIDRARLPAHVQNLLSMRGYGSRQNRLMPYLGG